MNSVTISRPARRVALGGWRGVDQRWRLGDFTWTRPQSGAAHVDIANAPLVFAGYGIVAPELGWDDYPERRRARLVS